MSYPSEKMTKGEKFVAELLSGEFKKNHRTNRGLNFTGGLEGMYFDYFDRYICSCGCHMMDTRLKKEEYYGGV
ncbi:MAG: hypothetical protein NC225_03180 [Clostridium sp.]|nr:hypothetical protein [Clostridium sp.]MCM1398468.1 hypothetical protein [Clostridium sp.]MCM1460190.1 hypothetical protein [Bacteroides sp.]